ncbi:energy transducer TonB [Geoalkalibacter halelectricus]|uniref:TonB family protein n=1 Tax=Geoalkalibacter halelectricus TaxID=2847045 RepID=A0ABY5ZGI1_9BACT|nr:TonB family protein [Geoalkalibacter halelectricus]MDO3380158.1 TonB family protein [Geoalkalibacter halelectricus]UWZ78268.1 TonB family protein [Geoalkalibacter halelectricus]
MSFHPRQDSILWWFIPLSLFIHLLLMLLVPQTAPRPAPQREDPVFVEVRPPQPRPRELDAPVLQELERPREEPAKRLGPQDQVVVRETAPPGEDTEDSQPAVTAPRPAPQPQPRPEPRPRPQEQTPPTAVQPPTVSQPVEQAPAPQVAALPEPPALTPPSDRPLPDLKDLLQLPQATESRLERQLRSKYRAEVERGDAVWLDMEKDILISFFQRFRNNIYGVWNYPRQAAERGEEGTSLLKITVNRDGSVASVQVMESSGSTALDQEAVRAVWRGASYGPLPRAYEEESLTIFAFFQYRIGRTFIFGGG